MSRLSEQVSILTTEYNADNRSQMIANLTGEFGIAEFLNEVNSLGDLTREIAIFEATSVIRSKVKEIKRIATYSGRMANGGVEKVVSSLIPIWISMGYEVVLYTKEAPSADDYPVPDGVERIVLPENMSFLEEMQFWSNTVIEKNIDVVISHEWMSMQLLWDMLAVKLVGIPFIIHNHNYFAYLYDFSNDYVMNSHRIFSMADAVLALSDTNNAFYNLVGCNSRTIQNPIEEKLFNVSVTDVKANNNFLYVGRLSAEKHVEDIIEAFSDITEENDACTLTIVGSGTDEYENKLKSIVSNKNLQGKVLFEGYHTDVSEYFKRATALVMASEIEGYPTVVVESFAHGVPIVMYELPYLTMMQDKKGYRSVRQGDKKGLSGLMAELATNRELLGQLSIEARGGFDKATSTDMIDQWRDIFSHVENGERFHYEPDVDTEKFVMRELLDEIRYGSWNYYSHTNDYMIGQKIMNPMRKLLKK